MAKLQRKTQKIFAGNTTSDQITAFGTAKTTNPVYTSDVNAIQTDTYTGGWTPSLMSDLAPFLQDSNALHYVETYQLAYLMQQGIAEWDAETEYNQGSIVSLYNNGNLELYVSLQNLNINHQLAESSYWKKYNFDELISNKMNRDFSNATTQPWNDRLKTDHSNDTKPYLKTSYVSGASGYNIWSNGYCEQWGLWSRKVAVVIPKRYRDLNYHISFSMTSVGDAQDNISLRVLSEDSFVAGQAGGNGGAGRWKTSGYLADGQY